jgi:hypothetical protein
MIRFFDEPSIVSIDKNTGKLIAIGKQPADAWQDT